MYVFRGQRWLEVGLTLYRLYGFSLVSSPRQIPENVMSIFTWNNIRKQQRHSLALNQSCEASQVRNVRVLAKKSADWPR